MPERVITHIAPRLTLSRQPGGEAVPPEDLQMALGQARFYLRRDMHGYFHANQSIHQKIVEASRNAALRTIYANFAGRVRRIRYSANFSRKRERWGEAMREHEGILDALRRRAGSELADILFAHLRNKRSAAVEHLRADDAAASGPG